MLGDDLLAHHHGDHVSNPQFDLSPDVDGGHRVASRAEANTAEAVHFAGDDFADGRPSHRELPASTNVQSAGGRKRRPHRPSPLSEERGSDRLAVAPPAPRHRYDFPTEDLRGSFPPPVGCPARSSRLGVSNVRAHAAVRHRRARHRHRPGRCLQYPVLGVAENSPRSASKPSRSPPEQTLGIAASRNSLSRG
jgi:hypothetical protein